MTQIDALKSNSNSNTKPTFFRCIGKGIKRDLKLLVPVWGVCVQGDDFVKQNQVNENLKDLKTFGMYDSANDEKASLSKRFLSGFAKGVVHLPIIGSFAMGKYKIQHEQLKDDIDAMKFGVKTEPAKKKGAIKTYFIGVTERLKRSIPIIRAYTFGKNIIEIENMQKDLSQINKPVKIN